MELREWLIILGLVLVTIIVVDGVRRLQRQRKVPRLDQAGDESGSTATDPEEAARQAEINWELPNGGARVVSPATQAAVEPKPKLQRQDHPGPSKVFSRMSQTAATSSGAQATGEGRAQTAKGGYTATPEGEDLPRSVADSLRAERESEPVEAAETPQETLQRPVESSPAFDDTYAREPYLAADEEDIAAHRDDAYETSRSRFSRGGMAAALRSGSQRVSQSMQRMSSAFQRHEDAPSPSPAGSRGSSLGRTPDLSGADRDRPRDDSQDATRRGADTSIAFEPPFEPLGMPAPETADRMDDDAQSAPPPSHDDVVTAHPVVEKARRHHVSAQRARETLAHAEEVIVISVMARNDEGFSGTDLLNLMLACGLRYSEMGIFLRYETEDAQSDLQFAMLDVVKPGTFDLEAMDEFATPGVTFLMPLPGAQDSAAAFEAMVETAMVLVRNMGGELKDENRSVMTAQTVGFARQRVQEFERRYRLHRYQAN